MAFGLGLLNGLRITATRVFKTYVGDFKHIGRRYDARVVQGTPECQGQRHFHGAVSRRKIACARKFPLHSISGVRTHARRERQADH